MSLDIKPLNTLPLGKKAVVSDLTAIGTERRRMLDLGLVKGASVKALHKSPTGDPTAYFIMGEHTGNWPGKQSPTHWATLHTKVEPL